MIRAYFHSLTWKGFQASPASGERVTFHGKLTENRRRASACWYLVDAVMELFASVEAGTWTITRLPERLGLLAGFGRTFGIGGRHEWRQSVGI